MRRFALRNSRGDYFDLMRKDAFFYDPDGLGFNKSNEYLRVGSSFVLTKDEADQGSVTGSIYFSSQSVYSEFIHFITYTPLILLYAPEDSDYVGSIPDDNFTNENDERAWWADFFSTAYKLDGRFTSVSKADTEHEYAGITSSVTFTAETKWYISKIFTSKKEDPRYFKYYNPEENPDGYYYNVTYPEGLNSSIELINDGSEESPTDIYIYGPVKSPSWELRYNGRIIQSGSITQDIPDGYYLRINSRNNHLEIALYESATKTMYSNMYAYIDFDKENFIKVPKSEYSDPYVFRVTGDTSETIQVYFELEEVHETV